MLYETFFLLALVATWAIEIPVLVLLARIVMKRIDLPVPRLIISGILCSALTLPYLWFVLPPYADAAYYPLIGEALVFIAEAGILRLVSGLDGRQSIACSALMNTASILLGLWLL